MVDVETLTKFICFYFAGFAVLLVAASVVRYFKGEQDDY